MELQKINNNFGYSIDNLKCNKITKREIKEIRDIIEWIEKNIILHIRVCDVVLKSGYGHWYFQKKFKRITGLSLWNYILKRRLTLAALELRFTDQSIAEIADKYQWCSQQGFTRSFTKRFGISPAKWRTENKVAYDKFQLKLSLDKILHTD